MKYRHFPAAVLAAGLFFCTLFSGTAACADDQRSELTQNQVETRQAYENAQNTLNTLQTTQTQLENALLAANEASQRSLARADPLGYVPTQ